MNVILLSMGRCGISWIVSVIKNIYKRLYGKELDFSSEKDRIRFSRELVEGVHGVYEIDPKILLKLGYKVIAIKRELEEMKLRHAEYNGYLEMYKNYEAMLEQRPEFFERIELVYKLLYEQEISDPNFLIISLEDLNTYTYSTFHEIIEFLDFKLTIYQKIKLFIRILRNKVKPFVVPCNPPHRDWQVYSATLEKGTSLCKRLQYLKKIRKKNEEVCLVI